MHEYIYDFLEIIIDKKIDKNDINKLITNIIGNSKMIFKQIIECEEYESFGFIINILEKNELYNKLVQDFYQYCCEIEININSKLFIWLFNNKINFFDNFLQEIIKKNNLNLKFILNNLELTKFFTKIINLDKYSNTFLIPFNNRIKDVFMCNYTNNLNIYTNIEQLILLTDICKNNDNDNDNNTNIYIKIVEKILINYNSDVKILNKYISYYKLSLTVINNKLKNTLLSEIIQTKNIEKINWYLNLSSSYMLKITQTNYLKIFEEACKTYDINLAKHIYNLIELCGYTITKHNIWNILHSTIYYRRWNNFSDEIIYELINFGVKPPSGYPKYTDYYNNIKLYNNN
jgi:hypothetical protein